MGWELFLAQYYSLTLLGVVIGFFYPFYRYLSAVLVKRNSVRPKGQSLGAIVRACFVNAYRFGLVTFVALTILGFSVGVFFIIWAIIYQIIT